ncbi:uncharacterized protein RHO25_006666 [Cercospora beticola]|uniref:Magnesium transport protein CorA n=1 Tax=Cercospora beticola TaxID=122368 RepID=A0ABZ0NR30_CERBT|nr:hypothetical protein RHO25_006666 [Cercospora beticola]
MGALNIKDQNTILLASEGEKAGKTSHAVSYSRLPTHEQQLFPKIFAFDPHEETDIAISPAAEFNLRCVLHRSRPQHASGKADLLPFENASTMTALWDGLALPSSYLHLANGYLSTAQSHEIQDGDEGATGFALTVYSLSKQGDWSMALSHNSHTRSTSVFWSLQDGVDADTLVNDLCDFQDYGWHPMLLPCIMFASVLRMATERRQSIKARLQTLEKTMARINTYSADSNIAEVFEQRHFSQELKQLFELLQSCRHDQGSREGRYDFWRSFHTVIKNGFEYAKHFMQAQRAHAARAQDYESAFAQHEDLQEWFTLTWIQLESIMARDQDHNTRVDNVSDMLYNLVQQRDIRLQSRIARASQRDSQDMKFIALLGSVFLPASLIATIFNVAEFVFIEGAALFGVYIGITIPFVAVMLILCTTREELGSWFGKRIHRRAGGASNENGEKGHS